MRETTHFISVEPKDIQGAHHKIHAVAARLWLALATHGFSGGEVMPLGSEPIGGRYGVTGDQKVSTAGAVLGTMPCPTRWTPR